MRRTPTSATWTLVVIAALVCAACGSAATVTITTDTITTATPVTTTAGMTTTDTTRTDAAPDTTDQEAPTVSENTPTDSTSADTADDDRGPASDCRRLTDFDDAGADDWMIVNDGVMGGRSDGSVDIADSVMRFTGSVITAGGGFTSVRLRLDGTELAATTRVELRIRADERIYGLTMEDDARVNERSVSHRTDFPPTPPADAEGWSTISIPYADLRPSVFGQPVDAPPFDPDRAREFGIIIADGVDGDFALDIDWIDACAR